MKIKDRIIESLKAASVLLDTDNTPLVRHYYNIPVSINYNESLFNKIKYVDVDLTKDLDIPDINEYTNTNQITSIRLLVPKDLYKRIDNVLDVDTLSKWRSTMASTTTTINTLLMWYNVFYKYDEVLNREGVEDPLKVLGLIPVVDTIKNTNIERDTNLLMLNEDVGNLLILKILLTKPLMYSKSLECVICIEIITFEDESKKIVIGYADNLKQPDINISKIDLSRRQELCTYPLIYNYIVNSSLDSMIQTLIIPKEEWMSGFYENNPIFNDILKRAEKINKNLYDKSWGIK